MDAQEHLRTMLGTVRAQVLATQEVFVLALSQLDMVEEMLQQQPELPPYSIPEFLGLEGAPARSSLYRMWKKGSGPEYENDGPNRRLPRAESDRWLAYWRGKSPS